MASSAGQKHIATDYLLSGNIFTAGPRASKYACFIAVSAEILLTTSYYKCNSNNKHSLIFYRNWSVDTVSNSESNILLNVVICSLHKSE